MQDEELIECISATGWYILQHTPLALQSVAYRATYMSEDYALELLKHHDVQFPPNLLETLNAPEPPTIDWFKRLPLIAGDYLWAVYVLVLEKPGELPAIYVGKSTNSQKTGYHARLRQHDDGVRTGQWVEKRKSEGFTITHKATLAWASSPLDPADKAMISPTEHYCFPECRWPLEAYTSYRGLCSHFSLLEFSSDDEETQAQRYADAQRKEAEKEAKRMERKIEGDKKFAERQASYSQQSRWGIGKVAKKIIEKRPKHNKTVVQQYGACLGKFTSKNFTS